MHAFRLGQRVRVKGHDLIRIVHAIHSCENVYLYTLGGIQYVRYEEPILEDAEPTPEPEILQTPKPKRPAGVMPAKPKKHRPTAGRSMPERSQKMPDHLRRKYHE